MGVEGSGAGLPRSSTNQVCLSIHDEKSRRQSLFIAGRTMDVDGVRPIPDCNERLQWGEEGGSACAAPEGMLVGHVKSNRESDSTHEASGPEEEPGEWLERETRESGEDQE